MILVIYDVHCGFASAEAFGKVKEKGVQFEVYQCH